MPLLIILTQKELRYKEREKVREQKRKSSHHPADRIAVTGISLLMVDFSVIKETVYILAHTVVRKITYL